MENSEVIAAAGTFTPDAVAWGMGAWFAGKVLGPSAEAMGEQLKAYFQSRCPVIFGRAGGIAQERGIDPAPIKPGLLARLIMDASFSDDSEEITEWWANLIVDASVAGSNKHAVFSDMMALLGPSEVKCLQDFIQSFPSGASTDFGCAESWMDTLHSKFESTVRAWLGEEDIPIRYRQITNDFLGGDPGWPYRPTEWRIPVKRAIEEPTMQYGHDPRYVKNVLTYGILQRVGILTPLDATFSVWGGNIWVRGIGLTPLGYEFYRACTGKRPLPAVESDSPAHAGGADDPPLP